MKPHIYWYDNSVWICQIPQDLYNGENMSDEDYYTYIACGAGKTIKDAYEDWVRDCGK